MWSGVVKMMDYAELNSVICGVFYKNPGLYNSAYEICKNIVIFVKNVQKMYINLLKK